MATTSTPFKPQEETPRPQFPESNGGKGKAKEVAANVAEKAKDVASNVAEKAKDVASNVGHKA